jgi:hypothetical protein
VVAAVQAEMARLVLVAVQVLLSFLTLAHNNFWAALSHQVAATPFTHLHLAVL